VRLGRCELGELNCVAKAQAILQEVVVPDIAGCLVELINTYASAPPSQCQRWLSVPFGVEPTEGP
jgi:hypothetical protein